MPMNQTNFKLPDSYNFLLWIIEILIEVPSNNMNVTSQCLEVVIALLGAEIASAQDVLNLARHQQFLELCWQAVAAMWDVKVS